MGIAVLTLASQLAVGSTQISFGILTRLARRFQILGIGNVLAFVGTIIFSVAPNYALLVLARVVRGLGISPYHPVGGAIMASSFPEDRAKALGLFRTAGGIGTLIAPLLVGAMLHLWGWRPVVFIFGVPFLLASILCFSVKEATDEAYLRAWEKKSDRFGLQEYKALFKDRNALIISLTMMISAGGRIGGVMKTYLAVILVDRFEISVTVAAVFFTAFSIGEVVGPLTLGWLSDRTSPLMVVRLNLALSAIFLLLILFPAAPGIMLALIVFMTGLFIGSRTSLMQALLIQSGPKEARIDTQLSLYFTIGAFSGPLWTLLVAFLIDQFGMPSAILTMALSFVFGMIILSFIRPASPAG
jgi:MFS family permease